MSVEIDPQELSFRRPFTVEVSQILKIQNPNSWPVAFKVKTTAPKQYCVRPNSGRIEPGRDVEVSVLLQAMKQEPPLDAKCRDKFLVQSVTITGDKEFANLAQIWESVDKSDVQEKKIRVNWLGEDDAATEPATTPLRRPLSNGVEATPEAPPAYSSPSEDHSEVPAPEKKHDIKPESKSTTETLKASGRETYEQTKAELVKAEAKITQLQADAASGLRQRNVAQASNKAEAPAQQLAQTPRQGTEGVPVQIVALLCLVSFLLAYFFF